MQASIPAQMKAAAIDRYGGPEVLHTETLPVPQPGPNQVLVRLDSAGIGVWDPYVRSGELELGPSAFPQVIGNDGAGEVVAVGDDVRRFRVGDRVYAYSFEGGFYAEYVAVDEDAVAPIPQGLSTEEAGALGADGVTALRGLDDQLHLSAGQTLMIYGASGGIGHLAVQLAKRMGARVLAVASGPDGVELVAEARSGRRRRRQAGRRRAGGSRLRAGRARRGARAGPRREPRRPRSRTIRKGGRIAYPNGVEPEPTGPPGVTVLAYDGEPGRDALERLNRLIAAGPFHVELGRVYRLEDAAQAHREIGQHHLGKLALRIHWGDGNLMKPTQQLHDLGQSLWLDNITRDLLDDGHAAALHRRALGHRAHLEPDHLRPGAQEQPRPTTPPSAEGSRQGRSGRGALLRARDRGPHAGPPTSSGPSTTGRTAWTAGSRSRSRRCSPTTPTSTLAAAKELHARAGRPNLFIKIPGHDGGPARHRGGDLRRRPGQRDAALLARALPRPPPTPTCAASSGASRPGSTRRRARSPRCSSAAGTRRSPARCPPRSRNRLGIAIAQRTYTAYRDAARLARAGSAPTTPAPARSACSGPAPGRRTPRRPTSLYVEALAAPFTVNTMPEATLKAFADHGKLGAAARRPTAATARRCSPASRGPASTSTRSPPSSRTRARRRS